MNLFTLLFAVTVAAQAAQPAPQARAQATQEPSRPTEAGVQNQAQAKYQIGAQDQLKITVYDADQLSGTYRVDADGYITFPLLNRIPAAGMTLADFQDRLRSMLSAGYIRNPQVRVDVEEYKSQSIFVSGEVRAPSEIRMTGTMTLLKALAQAGSPTSSASSELTIARGKKLPAGAKPSANPADNSELIHVNWRDLQIGKASDVTLQDGDVIFVPKAQTFFIQGYVRNTGSYVLEPGTTVEQAIALAGGLTEKGTTRGIKATRMVNGKSVEVNLNLSDTVQGGDVVSIKQRWF
jgi:polysaccharide export outer membrane protein